MDIDFERPGKSIHYPVIGTDAEAVPAGHVCVIDNGPGPRVLVVAGVHGDEYEAQLALHRLVSRVEASAVRGRLIMMPEVNFPASSHGTRTSPADGLRATRPIRSSSSYRARSSQYLRGGRDGRKAA